MKLSGISRIRNIESQIIDQIERERSPIIKETMSFIFDNYTIDQYDKIVEIFRYDACGGPKPSSEDYKLAATIWDNLPYQLRVRLFNLETSLKSFLVETLLERLGAHKPVEGTGQSAPPSID